jgi:hypothetical protein
MTQFNMINGAITRGLELHHQLRPKRSGTLTIPAFKVDAEGKTYSTQPVTIQVSGTRTTSAVSSKTATPIFLEASLSKQRVYMGEPLVYTLRIFNQMQLFGEPSIKDPVFHNLNRVGQKAPLQRQDVKFVNGRQYQVSNISMLVNTLASGEAGVDPVSMIFSLSPFDPNREVKSNAVALQVLPIPHNPAFDQAIGQFGLSMTVGPQELRANEAATIKVTIKGQGNLKIAVAPHFQLPRDIETYTPKAQLTETFSESGINAEKTFELTWIPRAAGQYSIPAGTWTYFDSASGQFVRLTTAAIHLNVQKGPARTAMMAIAAPVTQEESDIRYLHKRGDDWVMSFLKWGLAMLIILVLGAAIRFRGAVLVIRSWFGRLRPEARLYKHLETAMSEPNRFYTSLLKEVTTILIDHYHLPPGNLTTDGLRNKYPNADWTVAWQELESKSYQPNLQPTPEDMDRAIKSMIVFIRSVRRAK